METPVNQDLQLAFDFVRYTNRNIFLTGKAGTGKTTFLHQLKKVSPKRMIVVAPTGVAAINAGGVTIHSFFQLPFHPFIPSLYITGSKPVVQPDQESQPGYKMSREKVNIIRSLDLLIIDEISMVRADTLDAIDAALRRYRNRHLAFGGVQLLMIGDLQQLAPVARDDEWGLLGNYYQTPFFFGSRALGSTDYLCIELKHIYRQNDQVFIDLLNKVRDNKVSQEVIDELNKRYDPGFDSGPDGGYITLTTHNSQARLLNETRLERLEGKAHTFSAHVKDEFPEVSYPADNELVLKIGAQVMFIKNDISGERLYFNGKIGKVVAFEEDKIVVQCSGDEYPIVVEQAEWQNMKYTLDEETKEINEAVIGVFTQYPLRLAWAITIHKSQGLTFERAVIDARSAFAHGQVYVALSRCRSLDGLVLSSKISQRSIIDDPLITGFIRDTENNQPSREQLAADRRAYQRMLLAELFDFGPVERSLNYLIKVIRENRESILSAPLELHENALSVIMKDIVEISGKFGKEIDLLLKDGSSAESNQALQDRIMKAAAYFLSKLEATPGSLTDRSEIETDNKTVRKSVFDAMERLEKEIHIKSVCLKTARQGFSAPEYLDAKVKAAIEIPVSKTRLSKTSGKADGTVSHPALFHQLKEWRKTKAGELDLPLYMILSQKTLLAVVNNLPQTHSALKKVKGIGQKKAAAFGGELLGIITEYCRSRDIAAPAPEIMEKPAKKARADTKKTSYDLFMNGMSISQIAEERKLAESTIEGHLAYFVGTGDLPVDKFVARETRDLILRQLEATEDLRVGPVKEVLGDRVSWSDIRYVLNYVQLQRKQRPESGE